MNTKLILIAALLAGVFTPAFASEAFDDNGPAKVREVVRERYVFNGAEGAVMQEFDQASLGAPLMFMHGKAVKNAPYSAEAVSEQVRTLGDGNQIVHKSSAMSYRDSAGRTRQEVRAEGGAVRRVTIHDPADGATYILNPQTRTATKIGSRAEIAGMAAERAAKVAERSAERAGRIAERAAAAAERAAGEEIIIKRIERSDGERHARVREDVRIHVSKEMAEGRAMPGMEHVGPMIAGAFGDLKWSDKAVTKDLGSKDIDGVKAQGKLRSYEIPAGEIGNRNAIVVATETWYSPELQVTLLSRSSDPRSGERSYRLTGLKRDEPAAALFAVPADYTVKDAMAMARKRAEEKK
ncbi:MAG: hypothetical protein V4484_02210 [Pseudomonadota bacterium]